MTQDQDISSVCCLCTSKGRSSIFNALVMPRTVAVNGLVILFIFSVFQIDININPRLPSEYVNYLENPMEIINEAEKAAEKDMWSLMQFTENLRRQYGKEPYSMEIILKKLYVRRMAADLGVNRIYASGKMVVMKTNMSKKVFKLITDSMTCDVYRSSLIYEGDQIMVL